jgi:hypothetical protein
MFGRSTVAKYVMLMTPSAHFLAAVVPIADNTLCVSRPFMGKNYGITVFGAMGIPCREVVRTPC